MTNTQIQSLIENLRIQTAANSISPEMVANILTEMNTMLSGRENSGSNGGTTIESNQAPFIYCQVEDGKLYLRNADYYVGLGLEPFLFRYIKKRNRLRNINSRGKRGPIRKGWYVYGKAKTLRIKLDGQVERHRRVIQKIRDSGFDYVDTPDVFVNSGWQGIVPSTRITWGQSGIKVQRKCDIVPRMIRLSFAIGYALSTTDDSGTIAVKDCLSNLAVFHVRGQWHNNDEGGEYRWRFSL